MGVVAVRIEHDGLRYECPLQSFGDFLCQCKRLFVPSPDFVCVCGAKVVEIIVAVVPPPPPPDRFAFPFGSLPPFNADVWRRMSSGLGIDAFPFPEPPPIRKPRETKEDRERREAVHGKSESQLTAIAALQKKGTSMVYNLRIQSPFVLTQTKVKTALGTGFTILSIDVEKDTTPAKIDNVDAAVAAIVQAGYRAMARAYHPDLGGSTEVMATINRAKKELMELLESVKA